MDLLTKICCFNGVDGDSGEYSLPPMTGEDLSGFIQGDKPPENLAELKYRYQQDTSETFGVKEGVDPKKLDETGWGDLLTEYRPGCQRSSF